MESSDKPRFMKILNALQSVKPGKQLTDEGLDLFWNAMHRWSIDDFAAAASHLSGAVEFMPSPYHFEQLRKASKPIASEAWSEAMKRCLHWRTGKSWGDVIERAVAAVGGYRALAMADTETALPHIERRFKEAYGELDEVETVRAALPDVTQQPRISARDGAMKQLASPFPLGRSLPSKTQ